MTNARIDWLRSFWQFWHSCLGLARCGFFKLASKRCLGAVASIAFGGKLEKTPMWYDRNEGRVVVLNFVGPFEVVIDEVKENA